MFSDIFRNRKVLITGHTGFKGTWLAEWLLELGAEVGGYSLDIPSRPAHFNLLKHSKRIKNFTGDIRNLNTFSKAVKSFSPEVVFHLAAQSLVRPSYEDPKGTFDVNLGGAINVMEVLRGSPKIRAAILVATDKCYKNEGWEWGYRENDALGGSDPYSASKACAELAFAAYFQSYFRHHQAPLVSSVRAGNVIGGGDWAIDRIIPDCMRAWSKNQKIPLRNPNATRPWQHVLEPLSGYLLLGAQLLRESEAQTASRLYHGASFNFGPEASLTHSVSDLVEEFRKTWGNKASYAATSPSTSKHESRKKEHALLKLNSERAMNRLGWKPILSFEETVQMTSSWYKEYYLGMRKMQRTTHEQITYYSQLAKQRGATWNSKSNGGKAK